MDGHGYNRGDNCNEVRKMALTDKEYVESAGNTCPNCGCEENSVEAGQMEADGDYAWCNCGCSNCGAIWTDCYRLMGYNSLEN